MYCWHVSRLTLLALVWPQGHSTRVLGVIGNPVSHSRSPLIHNAALESLGLDMVYVPLKVDDLCTFLRNPTFSSAAFAGFSVTIPHKETALECASKVRKARPCA